MEVGGWAVEEWAVEGELVEEREDEGLATAVGSEFALRSVQDPQLEGLKKG